MENSTLLLTGCTGFIGEYLVGYLLHRQQDLAVLVRGRNPADAQGRIERLLNRLEHSFQCQLPQPYCLVGDLHADGLGLSEEHRAWIGRHVKTILHNAGNVDFHGRPGHSPRLTNVDGTRRLVDLCRELGIEDFHYVSTAYVCGDRRGVIRETELEAGQKFLSEYEQSKHDAELLLHRAGFPGLTVYRPAAVVGDSETGFTRSFHGVYSFARFTQMARNRAGAGAGETWHHPVRLALTGVERHHLVPVDWVAECITSLVSRPDARGKTYHLTSIPVTVGECEAALQQYFRYHGVTFIGSQPGLPPHCNEIEALFYEHLEPRYWEGDPVFDCSQLREVLPELACPGLDVQALVRLIDFAVGCDFGRKMTDSQIAHARPRRA